MQQLPRERILDITSIYGAIKQVSGAPSPALVVSSLLARGSITDEIRNQKPYRPKQWGANLKSEETIYMSEQLSNGTEKMYFFDAVFSTNHTSSRTITKHPVQWGAAISDHSFANPASVTLEIGMSDAMDEYSLSSDVFHYGITGKGKSVNAYRAFLALADKGNPLILNTRLYRYANMVIQEVRAKDDNTTTYSAKCSIAFEEIIVGDSGVISKSIYPAVSTDESTKAALAAMAKENAQLKSLLYQMREASGAQ